MPVCPSTNWSCSLSSGLVKPVTSPKRFRIHIRAGPSCEHLMHVALVGYIEHDTVTRRIEDAMQGHRGLHHAQIGADMTAVLVAICQQRGANLAAQFGELVGGKGLDIGRAGNAAQQMGVVAMGRGNARGDVVKARGPSAAPETAKESLESNPFPDALRIPLESPFASLSEVEC